MWRKKSNLEILVEREQANLVSFSQIFSAVANLSPAACWQAGTGKTTKLGAFTKMIAECLKKVQPSWHL